MGLVMATFVVAPPVASPDIGGDVVCSSRSDCSGGGVSISNGRGTGVAVPAAASSVVVMSPELTSTTWTRWRRRRRGGVAGARVHRLLASNISPPSHASHAFGQRTWRDLVFDKISPFDGDGFTSRYLPASEPARHGSGRPILKTRPAPRPRSQFSTTDPLASFSTSRFVAVSLPFPVFALTREPGAGPLLPDPVPLVVLRSEASRISAPLAAPEGLQAP